MFGSDILDIVVGMIFVFLLLSLICSALSEFIETLFKNRAKDLERGISELIGDPKKTSGVLAAIYNHGMVNSLFKGCYPPENAGDLPSYIPAASFALAVIDLAKNPDTLAILPPNLKKAVETFEAKAGGDAAKFQASLETWFNSSMDRVSGWYKRRAQLIIATLGLLVAIALNASTITIARTLSNDSAMRKALVAAAQARASQSPAAVATPAANPTTSPVTSPAAAGAVAGPTGATAAPAAASPREEIQQDISSLNGLGLPIGWHEADAAQLFSPKPGTDWRIVVLVWLQRMFGWLLTAIAISMGAPFWFDLLSKIITVRSTLKPDPNQPASSQP